MKKAPVILAFTGASGAQYGLRLLQCLLQANESVEVIISKAGLLVLSEETDLKLSANPKQTTKILSDHCGGDSGQLTVYGAEQWTAPPASGSARGRAMVVCPCSMGTLAAIAHGLSDNLIERAADVAIKEHSPLIIVPREAPFSPIHLENMLKLARLGVVILPASPGFYHRPQSIAEVVDFVVARILDHLQVNHHLLPRWGEAPHGESE